MKQTTSSLSFFKAVLLSISILALSSVSAYAERTNQANPLKYQLVHSDGVVTVVSSDGKQTEPYSEFKFDERNGWIAKKFDGAQDDDFPWIPNAEALCPNGSCIVNVDGKDKPVSSLPFKKISDAGKGLLDELRPMPIPSHEWPPMPIPSHPIDFLPSPLPSPTPYESCVANPYIKAIIPSDKLDLVCNSPEQYQSCLAHRIKKEESFDLVAEQMCKLFFPQW